MRYHASASTSLAFYAVLCHHVALTAPSMTSLPTAHLPDLVPSVWKASLTAVQSMKWLYLPQLVISPDPNNIDLVICSITAFSKKYRSGSTRVT